MWRCVAAGAVLALAACSGGGPPPAERLAAAAERTVAAGSARIAVEQRFSGVGPHQSDVALTGEGVVALGERRGRLTMRVPPAAGGPGGGEYEVVFDGTVAYLRMPELGAPTPWVKVDLAALEGAEGAEQLEQVTRMDPAEALSFLRAAVEEAGTVGREDVRGTPTTRYRVTVDLSAAAAQAPPDARTFLQQQVSRLGMDTLPMDVWLDDDGRVRRQSYTIVVPGGAGQPAAPDAVSFTVDYFDFGAPVDVTPPPPEETTDVEELLQPQA